MQTSILVSIIVPVYNVKDYLVKCIESVLKQTESRIELVLVDDGSNDGSELICDRFAEEDQRIRLIHQRNMGRCIARNNGLKIANGEWVLFLDSDDWIEANFVKELLDVYERTGSYIISCKSKTWYGDKSDDSGYDTGEIVTYDLDNLIKGLLSQTVVRFELWNKIIRRELLSDISFIPGQLSEEVHIDRHIFLKTNSYSHVDKTLHNYVAQRDGNTTSRFNPSRMCIFDEFDAFANDLTQNGKKELSEIINCIAMQFVILIYMEAIQFNKITEYKAEILSYEKRYYAIAKRSRFYPNRIGLRLFRISPNLYYDLLMYKKKKYLHKIRSEQT